MIKNRCVFTGLACVCVCVCEVVAGRCVSGALTGASALGSSQADRMQQKSEQQG